MSLKLHQPIFVNKIKVCLSAFLLIGSMITVTACSHEDNTQYAPLTYNYLTPIFFNVSQVTVQNDSANIHYPRDISNLSPTPPDVALTNMANNRFKAQGNAGNAVFTIQKASLQEDGENGVYGEIEVTLNIYNSNNEKIGSVHVSTSRTYEINPHKGDADSRANLYDVTQKMIQDLNVELEYQIRKYLEPWIVDATGNPISDSIKTQNLDNNPTSPTVTQLPAPVPTSPAQPPATVAKPKHAPSTEDMNAIFPAGNPDSSSDKSEKATSSSEQATSSAKYPVGVLGTLPQSAISKKY